MARTAPTAPDRKRSTKADTEKRGAATRKYRNTGTMAEAAKVPVDKPLTDQQKAFVKLWAEGESITSAMHLAGYSVKDHSYCYRMAKMPNILALKAKYAAQYEEASKMTKKKVMDMLLESYEMAKLAAEPATMVSAAREVGKLCGYYEPQRIDINVNVSQSIAMGRLNALSDKELLDFIQNQSVPPSLEALTHASDDTAPDDFDTTPEDALISTSGH